MSFKVRTQSGTYVAPFHGGFTMGEDSGYEWATQEEATDAVNHCQPFIQELLFIEEAA